MNKKTVYQIIFTIYLIIFLACGIYLLKIYMPENNDNNQYKIENHTSNEESPLAEESTPQLSDNPIDFNALQDRNSDVYSWIQIPDTNIDYPIVQSDDDTDDLFYLDHNIDKKYEFAGMIFSQKHNTKYYNDPVTVLYGHNMKNGSMFADLHKFERKNFFDKHDTIYIYTPGHILTYKIISAYVYDNRHIMNNFDFTKEEDFAEYISSILEPKSLVCNVRKGVNVTTSDKIITLSTCTSNDSQRYLVQGVLINDELTK